MPYGVTDAGYVPKPVDVIVDEIVTALRQDISQSLNTQPESSLGQAIGTFASAAGEQWENGEATYAAGSILDAKGEALDRKVALSPISRNPATRSTVTATVNLDAATTLAIGKKAYVDGDSDAVFETTEAVTNSGGSPADFPVQMQSTEVGAIRANAGTLTEILTPVTGWNSITNAEDAVLGSATEKDPALRARYMRSAGGKGLRTLESIRNAVELVDNVLRALPFENPLNVTDPATGAPPNSLEVVVDDGGLADDDDIAQAIWDKKGEGVTTFGTESGTATDTLADSQTVNFNRVTVVDIHLEITIEVNGSFSTDTGVTGLKADVADWGDAELAGGDDVVLSQIYCPVFDFGGVEKVVQIRVSDDGAAWQTTDWEVLTRERADLDTSRITIIVQ